MLLKKASREWARGQLLSLEKTRDDAIKNLEFRRRKLKEAGEVYKGCRRKVKELTIVCEDLKKIIEIPDWKV